MREVAPYIFWFLSMMGGLIGFGAIEAHLVNTHGYLFAFTLGIFQAVIGAILVSVLTYLACLLILYGCELFIKVRDWIRPPKTGS